MFLQRATTSIKGANGRDDELSFDSTYRERFNAFGPCAAGDNALRDRAARMRRQQAMGIGLRLTNLRRNGVRDV